MQSLKALVLVIRRRLVFFTNDEPFTFEGVTAKSRSTINEHILDIYEENKLDNELSMRKIGNSDFSTKPSPFHITDLSCMHPH